jgi:hypothetical protein
MAATVSISLEKHDACAKSEASYAESATSTQAASAPGVPAALANLVRRTLAVPRKEYDRLQAQERACRLQGNHRCCAW